MTWYCTRFHCAAALLLLVAGVVRPVEAQRLAPLAAGEHCAGQRISAVTVRTTRRDIVDSRLGALGRFVNARLSDLQPRTRERIVRGFLLLAEGDTCDELRRSESERILRSQRYVSDAVIRVREVAPGEAALDIELIDEFVLYSEVWGLKGLPAGTELGTDNLLGRGISVRGLVEVGRGGEVGWGAKFDDTQAFGHAMQLSLGLSSRPFADGWYAFLAHPFYSNIQAASWRFGMSEERRLYTFVDPTIRDVSLDYMRRRWLIGGVRRVGDVNSRAHFGAVLTGEVADRLRTLQIRENGPEPVASPVPLLRYQRFNAVRAGVSVGARRIRFVTVRGLGSITAPEDIAIGTQVFALALRGIDGLQTGPSDVVSLLSSSGGAGSVRSLLRWAGAGEWRFAHNEPTQVIGSGRMAWFGGAGHGQLTTISVNGAMSRNARVPAQLTFRDDASGLIGYRTSEFGGGERVIAGIEQRIRIPSPTPRAELALAAIAQMGRLWAGDTPYGVDTPWRRGIGAAAIVGLPAGSKRTLRIELGWPTGDAARHGMEFRLSYADFTGYFWGDPGALWLAREAGLAAGAVSP